MIIRIAILAATIWPWLADPALRAEPATHPGAWKSPYAQWRHGPPREREYFPIAVWLQHPKNAARYKAAGINLYVGLWKGPTEAQLAALTKAGMPVICHQNAVGLAHRDDPIVIGWMHGDEPDNAQPLGEGKGYGPPIPPAKIVADYRKLRAADPTRPVLLNLGQGVAWDGWHGRGVRTNHPEDYPEYVKGCDIASFDIYPVVHSKAQVAGKLWYVARGVSRLRKWTDGRRIVWNCIECTRISNTKVKPTPHQVKAEVWMSIVHGSTGLIYFVHQFQPRFIEAALLADEEMLAAVTRINRQIRELAPVLNGPSLPDAAKVSSSAKDVPIALMANRLGGATYLFAVNMRDKPTTGRFEVTVPRRTMRGEVLGEDRTVYVRWGGFYDEFKPYDVHIYKITEPPSP
ncbi:MAG: hypothetical protein AMJ81_06395 [Phycisphaerae bacterium SM23_33]|nr:MAG: hypothetical protein AMJ81_06395 [Phycisphaerae bacterium SM23_33]